MTSFAMTAGMVPLALGWGEGGEQTAPLGRAVIGGLAGATLATLLVLPTFFAFVQGSVSTGSSSLDPFDPASTHFQAGAEASSSANSNGTGGLTIDPAIPGMGKPS
jgi:hypothetical protein